MSRFGDHAWFRKLSLNNSLSLLDRLPNDNVTDAHAPNRACSTGQDIWNYEKIQLANASIMEAYFLPLSTCSDGDDPVVNRCGRRSLWQRLIGGWFDSSSTNTSRPKPKPQSKARAGERKRKPEARLTISPLECSGFS